MKTEFHTVTGTVTDHSINWPIPLSVVAGSLGIGIKDIGGVSWTRQEDDQLVELTVHFNSKKVGDS